MDPQERIESDPKVMLGKPVVRGTRITVEAILDRMAAGSGIDDVIADYPRLTRDDVLAALAFASRSLGSDEILPRLSHAG